MSNEAGHRIDRSLAELRGALDTSPLSDRVLELTAKLAVALNVQQGLSSEGDMSAVSPPQDSSADDDAGRGDVAG
ncbi:MAG: hypothetical protein FJX25_18340 [Alphaproteobacteria bacterium]|nr:hypothetical protein [Alphaproteobacteria bacterium]